MAVLAGLNIKAKLIEGVEVPSNFTDSLTIPVSSIKNVLLDYFRVLRVDELYVDALAHPNRRLDSFYLSSENDVYELINRLKSRVRQSYADYIKIYIKG